MRPFKAVDNEQYGKVMQEVGVTMGAINALLKKHRGQLRVAGYNAAEVDFIINTCDPRRPLDERFEGVMNALP